MNRALALTCLLACVLSAGPRKRINAGSIYDTIPHIVDGATWKTTIILANPETVARKYKLVLHGDNGAAKEFEFIGKGRASTFSGQIPAGGTVTFETPGTGSALNQGWAELEGLDTDYEVLMMAIFGTTGIPGRPDFEATIPAWHTIQYDGVLPFDNTRGYVTAAAVLNPSRFSAVSVPVRIYDESGALLKSDTLSLPAGNKTTFTTLERWPETAGRRGQIRFDGVVNFWSVLGLRFHPGGSFTTVNLLEP